MNRALYHICFTIFFMTCFMRQGRSQETSYPKFHVGINVFNLAHARTPAIDLLAEWRFSDRFSLRADGGPMVNFIHANGLEVNKYKGYQLGLGSRFYLTEDTDAMYSLFFEFRTKYKDFQVDIIGDFYRNNEFGAYQERREYTVDVQQYNIQFGFGQAFRFDHFRVDFIVGLGPVSVEFGYLNIPPDSDFKTNGTLVWRPDEEYNPYPHDLLFIEWIFGYLF